LVEVLFGSIVTSIGANAFRNKTTLTSVAFDISSSLTSIGNNAFENTRFSSITIPNTVTSLGNFVFLVCTNLTSCILSAGLTTIPTGTFSVCSALQNYIIPENITSLGESVFFRCTSLTSCTLSENITVLPVGTFGYCSGLTSYTIPDSITSVGFGLFERCINLTSCIGTSSLGNIISSL
jgi:hypothetical protein